MKRKKTVKIQNISQWHLLRQLNSGSFLKAERIPEEVMREIYYTLKTRRLGKNGFIVLCFDFIYDDGIGIEEAAGVYPCHLYMEERLDEIQTFAKGSTETWMVSYAEISECKKKVALIYRVKE